jgi:transcriptional regulator with XRE-family HTH domain
MKSEELEVATLEQLRRARDVTQKQMAAALATQQTAISRYEGQSDCRISTIRAYLQALGAEFDVIARFREKSFRLAPFSSERTATEAAPSAVQRSLSRGRGAGGIAARREEPEMELDRAERGATQNARRIPRHMSGTSHHSRHRPIALRVRVFADKFHTKVPGSHGSPEGNTKE